MYGFDRLILLHKGLNYNSKGGGVKPFLTSPGHATECVCVCVCVYIFSCVFGRSHSAMPPLPLDPQKNFLTHFLRGILNISAYSKGVTKARYLTLTGILWSFFMAA